MPRIIRIICESLGWDCGAHWNVDEEKQQYYCTETWSHSKCSGQKIYDV